MKIFKVITLLVLLALAVPVYAQPDQPERLTVAQVQQRLEQGVEVTFVDSRHGPSWTMAEATIPGAIHVGTSEQLRTLVKQLPKESFIVAYCT